MAKSEKNWLTNRKKGHFDKAGVAAKRFVKEFRFENAAEYTVGQEIKTDIFADGDHIDVTAVSKGKGFQGAIKRHGQSEDLWLTVPNITVMQVPMVLAPIRVKYSKENTCRVTWEMYRLLFRTLRSFALTQKITYC